ncbi:MAG: hypothetical protein AAF660_06795 [Pseudomonadota bacterium]
MSDSSSLALRQVVFGALSAIPWIVSMYAFYWLDAHAWTIDTPHRGKLSVMILGAGMLLSLLLYSVLRKR